MPTMTIPVEDFIFVLCVLIGGTLLLVTVVVDDFIGGALDALNLDVDLGGVSLMPVMLAFISMFGVGGLIATQVFDVHGGQAALVGTAFGAAGFGATWLLFSILRRSEGANPFSTRDLVGRDAFVAVSIPAGRFGSVYVKAEGQTHEFSATASVDVPAGTAVRITGVAGPGLVVTPLDAAADPGAGDTANRGR